MEQHNTLLESIVPSSSLGHAVLYAPDCIEHFALHEDKIRRALIDVKTLREVVESMESMLSNEVPISTHCVCYSVVRGKCQGAETVFQAVPMVYMHSPQFVFGSGHT